MYISENQRFFFELFNASLSKGNENIIRVLIEKAEELEFLDIEFEINELENLKNLAKYILYYKGYLHIYSNNYQFQEEVRDIIKGKNHTYVSKEERAKIINLFKTLLSGKTKDDLDAYTNESILGKDLLNEFFTVKYMGVLTLVNTSKRIAEKILESRNEIYLKCF